jgi:hypothetical protein
MSAIENSSVDKIKKDLQTEYQKNEWYTVKYASAMSKAVDAVIQKIKGDDIADPKIIAIWNKLKDNLKNVTNALSSLRSRGGDYHKQQINDLAHQIDNAENEVIKILSQVEVKCDEQNRIDINNCDPQWQQEYFTQKDDGILNLTSATNKPKIHDVLWSIMKEGEAWKIDYSSCKNPTIKTKMIAAIWWTSCYLIKWIDSAKNQTFVLQSNGKILDQRALIWEWVMLSPPSVIAREGETKNEKTTTSYSTLASSLTKTQPKLYAEVNKLNAWSNSFFAFTENKIDEHISYARAHGRELHSEPVSKSWMSYGGNFELHLINGDTEQDRVLYYDNELNADENQKQLRTMMDKNENEMLTYLNSRIQAKRSETEHLAKRESVAQENTESLSWEQLEQAIYGLWLMDKLVDSIKTQTWDQYVNAGDRALSDLQKTINDLSYTLEHTNSLNITTTILLLSKKYASFIVQSWSWPASEKKYETEFNNILIWPKNKTIEAIRTLGNATTIGDNTATTFLREEIIDNGDGSKKWSLDPEKNNSIDIKDEKINICFKNIKANFELTGDQNKDTVIKENINALYSNSSWVQWILKILIDKKLIPQETTLADKDIKQWCQWLLALIQEKQSALSSIEALDDTTGKDMINKNLALLQQKSSHSNDDLLLMQTYEIMLVDDNILNNRIESTNQAQKETIQYSWIAGFLQSWLTGWLARKWWGFKGTNADILNDSYGTSGKWWDFSDESVVMIKQWAAMMMEEIAFMVLSTALIASGIGAGAGAALAASRLWRIAIKLKSLRTLQKVSSLKNIQRLSKVFNNKLTRGTATLTAKVITPNTIKTWAMHTLLATSYRGERDKSFSDYTVTLLKNIWMYGILWVVGRSAEPWGKIYTAFHESAEVATGWLRSMAGVKVTSILAEELGMNANDLAINRSFWKTHMNWNEFTENLAMGLAFEALWGIKIAGKAIKNVVIEKWHWIADGQKIDQNTILKEQVWNNTQNGWIKNENGSTTNRIENSYNSYRQYSSPEQAKLQNHTKRVEKQSVFKFQILQAQDLMKSINETYLSSSMKVLRDAWDIMNLSPNDIKRVQREIWAEVDGIWWDKSLNRLSSYLDTKLSWHKNHVNLPSKEISSWSQDIQTQMMREAKQWRYAWELLAGMNYLKNISDDQLPEELQKLKNANTDNPLRKEEVEDIQKKLWLWDKDVDGVFWPKTLKKLEEYLQDRSVNKTTAEDLDITKQILREEAMEKWIGNKTAFFAEAETNSGKITVDGTTYSIKGRKTTTEIKWPDNKILNDKQKIDLYNRYQDQKVEEYVNNDPDVKNAQVIDEGVVNNKTQELNSTQKEASSSTKTTDKTTQNDDFNKAAEDIVSHIFDKNPNNLSDATSKIEQFGAWLWRTKVWPTLQFLDNARQWLQSIKIKFPDIWLKNKIDTIIKSINNRYIQIKINNITAMKNSSDRDKLAFLQKADLNQVSEWELRALYELSGWTSDHRNRANIKSKDQNTEPSIMSTLRSRITENIATMKTRIDAEPILINHNFSKSPELTLKNQEINLNINENTTYVLCIWKQKYSIIKQWDKIYFVNNKQKTELRTNQQYAIGKWHESLTGTISDDYVSKDHMEIIVKDQNNIVVRDKNSTNGTTLKLTKQAPQGGVIYTKEVKWFEQIQKSKLAQGCLQAFWRPIHRIAFGENTLYTSQILKSNQSWKSWIIWYTQTWEIRYFYKSWSEGEWRSCPWKAFWKNNRLSKAESITNASYETTTKVDAKIWAIFDTFQTKAVDQSPQEIITDLAKKNHIWQYPWTEVLLDQMTQEVDIEKMFTNPTIPKSAVDFYQHKKCAEVVEAYKNLQIPWLEYQNMIHETSLDYTFTHELLGTIQVYVMKMNFKWKPVYVHFASAKNNRPNDIFITNIVYVDAKINSFGIYDKQINAWPLVAKPLDYKEQAPSDLNNNRPWMGWSPRSQEYPLNNEGDSYSDIRFLYQENPLIKSFKNSSVFAPSFTSISQ